MEQVGICGNQKFWLKKREGDVFILSHGIIKNGGDRNSKSDSRVIQEKEKRLLLEYYLKLCGLQVLECKFHFPLFIMVLE